jgi:predicted nucleotidyltransferase
MTTLSPEQTTEVIQRLVAALNPDQIYLFGSHAWGTPHKHSDVDLMVVAPNGDLTEHQRAVKAHLALLGMGLSKDILVPTRAEFDFFRGVRGSLTYKIAHEGKLIYDRSWQTTGAPVVTQGVQ